MIRLTSQLGNDDSGFEHDMGKKPITVVTARIGNGEITGSLSDAIPPFEAFPVYCGYTCGAAVRRGTTALQLTIATLNLGVGNFVKDLFALFNEFQAAHRCRPASPQLPPA